MYVSDQFDTACDVYKNKLKKQVFCFVFGGLYVKLRYVKLPL